MGMDSGSGVAVRRVAGLSGVRLAWRIPLGWVYGYYFWVDPAEELVVVFMAHAPGTIRYYHRQLLHALVTQALQ